MKKTAVIIGASGLVGGYLFEYFSKSIDVVGTTFKKDPANFETLDMRNEENVTKFFADHKPNIVFLPAAMTHVDRCETEPNESYSINVSGTKNIVECAARTGAKLVFFSTEYVFDGVSGPYSETDSPNPINIYGKHKMEAEKIVRGSATDSIIIRTTWVFGWEKLARNFAHATYNKLKAGEESRVPMDEISTPTYSKNMVAAIDYLLGKDFEGTVNIAGTDRLSKYEWAQRIANAFGLGDSKEKIKPLESDSLGRPAKRPKNAGLLTGKLKSLGFEPCSLDEALFDMKTALVGKDLELKREYWNPRKD
ncbi:TPA: SDR family oxidoreductase [Candidatus Micrarchaeota archaeon]|nr:SDR family oxidoreductase [Candidatus Micrarchaeota archaeon]